MRYYYNLYNVPDEDVLNRMRRLLARIFDNKFYKCYVTNEAPFMGIVDTQLCVEVDSTIDDNLLGVTVLTMLEEYNVVD